MPMPASVRLALIAAASLMLAGCGRDGDPLAAAAAPSTEQTTTTTTTTTTPTKPPAPQITFTCGKGDSYLESDVWMLEAGGDMTVIWSVAPKRCTAARDGSPLTPLEQQAVTAAGYSGQSSVSTLYGLCAQVDPNGVYVSPSHTLSSAQIPEVTGMLTLCPTHPQAALLQDAIGRGQADAAAEAAGELVHSGTFLVGTEIQPGTYVVEGEIENCYWERTDRTGEIIDNGFSVGARRVEVTIRASDYSFHNEHCGEWRKVS